MIKNLQVGSLVTKDLCVIVDGKTQIATVFGTVEKKEKGGRWLVLFENDCSFKLKPSEFEFVSKSKNQSVLSLDGKNKMICQSPKKNHLLKESNKNKSNIEKKIQRIVGKMKKILIRLLSKFIFKNKDQFLFLLH